MHAIDTNVLVYAHDFGAPEAAKAQSLLTKLGQSGRMWGFPWPCVYEFIRVATHPVGFRRPLSTAQAIALINHILGSDNLVLLGHQTDHWTIARDLMRPIQPIANAAFDIQIAAILLENNVELLFTRDRRFAQFGIRIEDPFA